MAGSDTHGEDVENKMDLFSVLCTVPTDRIIESIPPRPLSEEEVIEIADAYSEKHGDVEPWRIDAFDIGGDNLSVEIGGPGASDGEVLQFALRSGDEWIPFEYQGGTGWGKLEQVVCEADINLEEELLTGALKRLESN